MTNHLDRTDIFRAYQCPEMFAKHVRDGATEIDPKAITRTFIENNLPAVLANVRDKGPGYAAAAIYSEADKPYGLSNLHTALHQTQIQDGCTPPTWPDTWTREKNLYLGVALWLSKHRYHDPGQRAFVPYEPRIRESFGPGDNAEYRYSGRPALKTGLVLTLFVMTSSLRSEDDLWSDVALGTDIAALIDSLAVAAENNMNELAAEVGSPDAFKADTIEIQQIVTGNKAEQWYENPLCRYWRHRDGGITFSGKINGTGVRKPAWEKHPVLDVTSTDAMSTVEMEDHINELSMAVPSDPEIAINEMFPPPLRIGLDKDTDVFALQMMVHSTPATITMRQHLHDIHANNLQHLLRNYTACRFPTVCRFWEDCWRVKP